MKKIFILILLLTMAAFGGWLVGNSRSHSGAKMTAGTERKILYYQSTMHPWVKSDKPGKCPICGMDLVPIYEGGATPEHTANTNIVMLSEGSPQVAAISTAPVKREKLTRTLRFAGTIDDNDARHRIVSAYTGGRLEKLFVNYEGAEVEAGQPLALLYSPALLAAAREYTTARQQGNTAIATIGATRLQQMGLTLEQIANVPSRKPTDLFFEILAPVSGTVVTRAAYEGQYVTEGEKLMEIGDFSTMWLQFNAYEQDLPFLRVGQTVEVTTPSLPGTILSAPITFFNPNLDMASRTVRVRVDIPNPKSADGLHREHELLHKTYAEASVLADLPDVLTIPRSAVLWPGAQPRVYVEKSPGNYEQRLVSLGRAGDNAWEVVDGLAEDERVVVSGNMLIDGQAQINSLAAPLEMKMPVENNEALAFFAAVSTLGEALAADDLVTYRAALEKLPQPPEGLVAKAPKTSGDLAGARLAFEPFSRAVSAYAQGVRSQFPTLKIFTCPMSAQAAAGLAENAEWIQLTPTIRNPYLGQSMVDCGSEILPSKP